MLKKGYASTPEYLAWHNMRRRCYEKTCKSYADYGGRGITVCDRWRDSFENFIDDMGQKPTKTHSIDRINNNSGYSPFNCRWASKEEQSQNRRRIRTVDLENNTSGYSGVVFLKDHKKWRSKINYKGKDVFLGKFDCKHEAAMVFDMFKEKNGVYPYDEKVTESKIDGELREQIGLVERKLKIAVTALEHYRPHTDFCITKCFWWDEPCDCRAGQAIEALNKLGFKYLEEEELL